MSDKTKPLTGKTALITGASRGIGRSIALALAEAGATVAVSARGEADLVTLLAEIEDNGGQGMTITCDVTDADAVAKMQTTVSEQLGQVDILVNNAGMGASHKFIGHPDELWDQMMAVNLTSVYLVTKAFAGGMLERKSGRIINIASTASKVGGKYIAAYTAAKHGVLGLTRALAVEFAPHVTVNAICPSYVDTPMTDATIANIVEKTGMPAEQARASLVKKSPQRRLIEPDEIADLTVYLAQDSSRGITGQAINIDGGSVMF